MRPTKLSSWRRRAAKVRARIGGSERNRLSVHRTGRHIYAQLLAPGGRVLVTASSAEKEMRTELAGCTGMAAAELVGRRLAEKTAAGSVRLSAVFDRGGFAYRGRVRAVAEGARAAGMEI